MAFLGKCPHCQKSYVIEDKARGKRLLCKKCKKVFVAKDVSKKGGMLQFLLGVGACLLALACVSLLLHPADWNTVWSAVGALAAAITAIAAILAGKT
jgi:predicted Zn finger-like uncharacterized protein